MSRARAKSRMKLISGGKQLCLIRDTEEVLKFFEFTAKTGSEAASVIEARREACSWCFSLLKEEEDHLTGSSKTYRLFYPDKLKLPEKSLNLCQN